MSQSGSAGYGKPPKSHQFKKGHSGNPKGRPKGSKNLRTDLSDELYSRVSVTERGRKRTLTKQQVLIKKMMAEALSGQHKPRALLLQLMMHYERTGDLVPSDAPLAESDQAIIERFLRRVKKQAASKSG
jgi:hypothetical protein